MIPKPQPRCTVVAEARAPAVLSIPPAQWAAPHPAAHQRRSSSARELCGSTATCPQDTLATAGEVGHALPGALRDGGALPAEHAEPASPQLVTAGRVFQDSSCLQPAWHWTAAPAEPGPNPANKLFPWDARALHRDTGTGSLQAAHISCCLRGAAHRSLQTARAHLIEESMLFKILIPG